MSGIVLDIRDLTKVYGSIKAVEGLTLEIPEGSVYGILGPNGSGKTTTLGMVLGVTNPTRGSFLWFGKPPGKEVRRRVGAILEVPVFFPYLSAVRNLRIIAAVKKLGTDNIEECLRTVGLYDRRNSPYRTFSLGMKQRLAIAATLLGKPEVLILDEPTNGLDPIGIAEVRDLIREVSSRGITIILASHILDEVQKTCSHVVVIEKGRNLFTGKVEDILQDSRWVEVASDSLPLLGMVLQETEMVESVKPEADLLVVKLREGITTTELNKYLSEKGIIVSHLAARRKSLENYFLELLSPS